MHKIITGVKTTVKRAIANFNNDKLQNMDNTFAENMDFMTHQHTTATQQLTKSKDDNINRLHAEIGVLIVNISKEITTSPTIIDARNSIISNIAESGSKAIQAINSRIHTRLSALQTR